MIESISANVANWLVKQGIISSGDCSLFAYATYSLLFGLAPVFIILVLGTAFGMLYEGFLLILPFFTLRKFAGGYHLKSVKLCLTTSVMILALALAVVKRITGCGNLSVLSSLVFIAVIILCRFSPIDSEARQLSQKENAVFRRIAQVLSIAAFGVYLLLLFFGSRKSTCAFGMGCIIPASLQIPSIVEKRILQSKGEK